MDFQLFSPSELRYLLLGANIESFLVYPKHFLKKSIVPSLHKNLVMILVIDVETPELKLLFLRVIPF
jgi:hypothetical protein